MPASPRGAAEQPAASAAALAAALEERVALGEATPAQWLALARAQLRRTPPEPARALHAAWQNFAAVPAGEPEIPALLLIAEALSRLERPAQQIAALEAVVQRAPGQRIHAEALAAARRAAGLLVARINTEAEAEPPRACLAFTVPPSRRADWQPQDWLRAEPALPDLAVTREGDQLCAIGLPLGRTTRLILRAGLPGEDGLRLNRDTALPIAMPDRAPRLAFDARAFLLPRNRPGRVPLALVNVSAVNLQVVRVTERNLVPLSRDFRLGEEVGYLAEGATEQWGREIWSGAIEVPRVPVNAPQRLAVPLPPGMEQPGLYLLIARAADGGRAQLAAQPVIVTDLGLVAVAGRGRAGRAGARPGRRTAVAGVRVALMSRSNDILAEAATGADGLVRFAAPCCAAAARWSPSPSMPAPAPSWCRSPSTTPPSTCRTAARPGSRIPARWTPSCGSTAASTARARRRMSWRCCATAAAPSHRTCRFASGCAAPTGRSPPRRCCATAAIGPWPYPPAPRSAPGRSRP
jgi:hypothetical protein